MRKVLLFLLIASCGPSLPCSNEIDSASSGAECCDQQSAQNVCFTHPFGRKTYCDEIERPQTTENCFNIFDRNPGICFDQYEACRVAIREAECDECPIECIDIQGACE